MIARHHLTRGLLCVVSILFASISTAYANSTTFTYHTTFTEPPNCATAHGADQKGAAGWVKSLSFTYDAANQTFGYDFTLKRCSVTGYLGNAFTAVVNSGPNPRDFPGESAMLMVDGTDCSFNGVDNIVCSDPIVTVYGYNGGGGPNNFSYRDGRPDLTGNQTPDRILSSLVDNSFIVTSLITDMPALDERRFQLTLSTANINSHVPLWPGTGAAWGGMLFSEKIGYWFHPFLLSSASYCSAGDTNSICQLTKSTCEPTGVPTSDDCNTASPQPAAATGYLKSWNAKASGYVDRSNRDANGSPMCTPSVTGPIYNQQLGCYEMGVGDSIAATFAFVDSQNDQFTVTHNSTFPANAVIAPPSGTVFNGSGDVTLDWTSSGTDNGNNYSLTVTATDIHGADQECNVNVCIDDNLPPVCNLEFATNTPNECEGDLTSIELDASGSSDPENDPLTYTWTTTCPNTNIDLTGNMAPEMVIAQLTDPGDGIGVDNCTVTVTVDDGVNTPVSCPIDIQVDPCELDCLDVPNGDAELDPCGICNGDGSTCTDCAGDPNGNKVVDPCGVCGGDGSTCLDCAGDPNGNAEVDQCGICDGTGLTCANCITVEISGHQTLADNRVKDMEGTMRQQQIGKIVRLRQGIRKEQTGRKFITKKDRDFAKAEKSQAFFSQDAAWQAIWRPSSVNTTCELNAITVCIEENNETHLTEYRLHATNLLNQAKKLRRKHFRTLRKFMMVKKGLDKATAKKRAKRQTTKIFKIIKRFYDEGMSEADKIPLTNIQCASAS